MEWFRFYDEALNDPKVQRLPGELFKTWVNLLCLANQNSERGFLPCSMDDIAWALREPAETVRQHVHTLQGQGLLDWLEDDHCYVMHNWHTRQKASDDVAARVRRHRENVTQGEPAPDTASPSNKEGVTLHVTDTERYGNALEQSRAEENRAEQTAALAPVKKSAESHPIPPDFVVTDAMRAWARSEKVSEYIDLDRHTRNFVEYWTEGEGQGKRKKNWLQAWRTWMRGEAERAEARGVRSLRGGAGAGGKPQPERGRTEMPGPGESFETDSTGRWKPLLDPATGEYAYGAESYDEALEKHKDQRDKFLAARRNGTGAHAQPVRRAS